MEVPSFILLGHLHWVLLGLDNLAIRSAHRSKLVPERGWLDAETLFGSQPKPGHLQRRRGKQVAARARPSAPAVPALAAGPCSVPPVISRWKPTQRARQPRAGSCVFAHQRAGHRLMWKAHEGRTGAATKMPACLSPPASQGGFSSVILLFVNDAMTTTTERFLWVRRPALHNPSVETLMIIPVSHVREMDPSCQSGCAVRTGLRPGSVGPHASMVNHGSREGTSMAHVNLGLSRLTRALHVAMTHFPILPGAFLKGCHRSQPFMEQVLFLFRIMTSCFP